MAYLSIITLQILTLLPTLFPSLAATSPSPTGYTKLVYKGCADQRFQDPSGIYSQNLKTLYSSLLSQSTQKPYSASTAGSDQTAITGLYQCRGDLTTSQCSDCVAEIPDMASKLCGGAVAARVQLHGCYLRYEVAGFKRVPETQLLYKTCGSIRAQGRGFGQRRDTAFGMVRDGVNASGSLFYAGSFESLYVLGQCEGDLSSDGCGACVRRAVDSAVSECGDSISGQVYLYKCCVSYSYYPNGVPGISSASSDDDDDDRGTTTGQNHTQRTVAIVVGGVAALGFLIACLLFARSVVKKHGGNKY